MPRFFVAAGVRNLSPPDAPFQVRDVTVERAIQPRLDPAALAPLAPALGDLYTEAIMAATTFSQMAAECIFHSEIVADDLSIGAIWGQVFTFYFSIGRP